MLKKELSIFFCFLISDAADANENESHLNKEIRIVDNQTTLKLRIAPGGGNMIILSKLNK